MLDKTQFTLYVFLKGALSNLRKIFANESPLKIMKNVFLFHFKSSFRSQDI